MGGKSLRLGVLILGALLLAAAASGGAEPPPSCEGVRKVFQLRQLGSLRGIPESPRAGKGKTRRGQTAEGRKGRRGPGAALLGCGDGGFEFGAAGGDERVGGAGGGSRRCSPAPAAAPLGTSGHPPPASVRPGLEGRRWGAGRPASAATSGVGGVVPDGGGVCPAPYSREKMRFSGWGLCKNWSTLTLA